MKANELMTGVFVYFNCFDGNKIIVCVTGFKDGIVYGDSKYGSHWCNIERVEPIPLTPEILEKNGWEKCNIDVVDDDEQYGCAYDSFYFTWWRKVKLLGCYFEDKNVGLHYEMISELSTKYIHELQHALRLCGIEKEIIL